MEFLQSLVQNLSRMTFGQPSWWLLVLAVPLFLAMRILRDKGPRLTVPMDHAQAAKRHWSFAPLRMASILPCLILAVAVILWCRPQLPDLPTQTRAMTNVEMVLDVSGSMTAQFGEGGNRYDAAMVAIESFTRGRKGDAFGLTIFGNEVLRWTPLTRDLSAIRNATPFLRPSDLPQHFGGTEIGKAIRFSHETLQQRGEGDAMIILLSDGESADLGGSKARDIGQMLAGSEIVLYAIHIGNGPAPSDLYDMSRPTGGQVFAAEHPDALQAVFQHIDGMQPVKLKPAAPQQVDYFKPFAACGLLLLGFYQLSLFGMRYTPW